MMLKAHPVVNVFRIFFEVGFCALAETFAVTPVVDHQHIVAVARKIAGIFRPTFHASGVAVEIHQ